MASLFVAIIFHVKLKQKYPHPKGDISLMQSALFYFLKIETSLCRCDFMSCLTGWFNRTRT